MSIVVSIPSPKRQAWWVEQLQSLMQNWQVRGADDPGPPAAVRYVVVWQPEPGWMARFVNLKAIVSIGAGIDHVLADPDCPRDIPIIRTTGPDLVQRMREYIALQVLRMHRQLPTLQRAQQEQRWSQIITPTAGERRVGLMGLGTLGSACAHTLLSLGFPVSGWSRSGSMIDGARSGARSGAHSGVRSHAGDAELDDFLADCDILVCLLPLTTATRQCLRGSLFDRLPHGACLINAARGDHLHERDLLRALDSGQISQAALDVFSTEPLPADHPFWGHPCILVTPHVASLIDPATGGRLIAANIEAFERDGAVADQTDPERGY